MTLDEKIEWLEQEAIATSGLASIYLKIHCEEEFEKYSDLANRYQWIADSLKDYRELKSNGTI